jgi:hypothetical protein
MNSILKTSLCALLALGLVLTAAAQQGNINTVVGGGPTAMPALEANVYYSYEVATDAAGNVYYATPQQARVYKATPGGNVTLIAGVAGESLGGFNGDGILATAAELNQPQAVAVDNATPPNVYIADTNNCLIRRVDGTTGLISTVAGYAYVDVNGPHSQCGWGSYTDNQQHGFTSNGDGGPATLALISSPLGLGFDTSGNLYFADQNNGRVRKVNTSGNISTVAGGGGSNTVSNNCQGASPWGDGALATSAYLCVPYGVAVDNSVSPPNIFVSHNSNACVVREVVGGTGSTAGNIYRVAGEYSPACGFSGDGGVATSAQLSTVWQVSAIASAGTTTVAIGDYGNSRVREFTVNSSGTPTPGNINTVAGGGSSGCTNENIPATTACIQPIGVAFDHAGNFFIGDYGYLRVREVSKSTGNINSVAGYSSSGNGPYYYPYPIGNTNIPGTDYELYQPFHSYLDPSSGNLYIAGDQDEGVHLWNPSTNLLTQVAGNGVAGYAGDTKAATDATVQLYSPAGVVKDAGGNTYLADFNNCVIRKINASDGTIHTVVGGTDNTRLGCGFKDGSLSVGQIYTPAALAIDSNGNLDIADYNNCAIRQVNFTASTITTIAGTNLHTGGTSCGFSGDSGPATSAKLQPSYGVAVDGANNVYIADTSNLRVRRVDGATGIITTLAGTGNGGYNGDGPGTGVYIYYPYDVASDANGNVFVADYYNSLVRWVEPAGNLISIAGLIVNGNTAGQQGFSGDGGPATQARLYNPSGVTLDAAENLYITDLNNSKVRKVNAFAGFGRSNSSFTFEQQTVGTTSSPEVLTLGILGQTNISSIQITPSTDFSEVDDCVGLVAAGQACYVEITFNPSQGGFRSATLTINSNAFFANNANTVSLQGEAAAISFKGTGAFAPVLLGAKGTQTITLTNNGTTTATIKKAVLTETTDFSIATTGTCKPLPNFVLAAKASCTIVVTFAPLTIGSKVGQLQIFTTDPSPILLKTSGSGTIVKVPTKLVFNTITHGTTESANLVVTNGAKTGGQSLTVSATNITGPNASLFTVLSNGCSGSTAPGASCNINIQFAPTAVGSFKATITLTTNGGSNPAVPLSGSAN